MTNAMQRRTKRRYLALCATGLCLFYGSESTRFRTIGLSLLLPGAGFLAIGGFSGYVGFAITIGLLPLCMFAWFGAGGLAFPLANWLFSSLIAVYLVGPKIVESSAVATLGLVAVIYTYLTTRSSLEEVADIKLKERRNEILVEANTRWEVDSVVAGPPGSREMTLEQLRFLQNTLELAIQDHDDFSNMTHIDQFQPAAYRYQLDEFVNVLGTYQCYFAPSFHGIISTAMRNSIEKSLTPRVLGYWKWESLWGNFSTASQAIIS